MGTHEQLIRQRGHYHNLYTHQFHRAAQQEIDQVFDTTAAPA
jgi:hypothetical protein